jgi:ABC-2 type transport system permease protein
MEYKFNFFSDLLVTMVTSLVTYAGIWVMFNNFNTVNEWTYYEVILLYTINFIAAGVAGFVFYAPMMGLEEMIRSGSFDGILIRPINPFINLISTNFTHTHLAHVITGAVVFCYAINKLEINWSFYKIAFLVFIIIGAVLIQTSMLIIGGSLGFWFTKSTAIVDLSTNPRSGIRRFLTFPISIYEKWIQIILTFILPYAFINYYPSCYLLDKSIVLFHPILKFGTPIVGVLCFFLAYFLVWKNGLKNYKSTGS